ISLSLRSLHAPEKSVSFGKRLLSRSIVDAATLPWPIMPSFSFQATTQKFDNILVNNLRQDDPSIDERLFRVRIKKFSDNHSSIILKFSFIKLSWSVFVEEIRVNASAHPIAMPNLITFTDTVAYEPHHIFVLNLTMNAYFLHKLFPRAQIITNISLYCN
ncbi:hypothetical protein U9M48_002399, partial [Paspalum notatum var. saurae]